MERSYLYNASAMGFAGTIKRPFVATLEAQASCSLPLSGGYASSRVDNFKFKEIFSFKAAHSQASGIYSDKDTAHNTLATSTVEGLDIQGVVTAESIVSRLSSRHPKNDAGEPAITPFGSYYEGLRIAGDPVEVELAIDMFHEFDTCAKMRKALDANKDVRSHVERASLQPRQPVGPASLESHGIIGTTLVRRIKWGNRELTPPDWVIVVPNFGRIYLAEIFIKDNQRQLSMLRVEMGSPMEGTMECAIDETNGSSWP